MGAENLCLVTIETRTNEMLHIKSMF